MRRRATAHNILLALILLTSGVAAQYSYIVKFTTEQTDVAPFTSALRKKFTSAGPMQSVSIVPLPDALRSPRSAFAWGRYRRIVSSIPLPLNILSSIRTDPSVVSIEPVHRFTVESHPNDSAFSAQWNLRRIGVRALYENGTITDSLPSVIVGVIDTGIDEDHPDLAPAIAVNAGEYGNGKQNNGIDDDNNGFIDDWRGYDFVTDAVTGLGGDNDPADAHGHGTSVSGIIGAVANNGIGIAGIAPVRLLPLKAFDQDGNGTDIDIAAALIYAAENGAEIVNMSFGDVVRSTFLSDAVAFAASRNVVLVASSGNDGSAAPHFPSDLPEVISTGSVGRFDNRSIFSSHSPSLDIMAPGEQIPTTAIGSRYTDQFSGTSAAAPHVTGVCALVKSLDKLRIRTSAGRTMLSNTEIAGIIANTASDVGPEGWDDEYGAGIVDAAKAVAAVSGSLTIIHSPGLDESIVTNTVPVIVSAIGPNVASVTLSVGAGDVPTAWTELRRVSGTMFLHDTLTLWNSTGLSAGTYILRLTVASNKGVDVEFRQRVVVDPASPRITNFRFRDSVIIGTVYGAVIEARTDRYSDGMLAYRKAGTLTFTILRSAGMQHNHTFTLTPAVLEPGIPYEFYTEFTEHSSLHRSVRFPTTALAGFDRFTLTIPRPSIPTTGFALRNFSLPEGFLLNSVRTVNGLPWITMNAYTAEGDFGTTKVYGFDGTGFRLKDSTSRSWVPRAFEPTAATQPPSLLVQDHGVTRLFRADTVNSSLFANTVWGDSADVWGAGMADLNGDGASEIIARSSTEYLLYQRTGNGYTVAAHLPDPSPPLEGEARNQFGPPKAITGNFTGGSMKEIIVADYDGDVLLYRQPTPTSLNFTIAAIDTTELYEMSDYLVKGDFNGDGIPDVAVAGHSNGDWNDDREYDAPIWTVRVYSHRPTDAVGTVALIWQQSFFGITSGSGHDNGVSAGKLRSSDAADALFIAFSPNLYVFQWDSTLNTFRSLWTHASSTNAVLVHDFDNDGYNDIGFRNGDRTEFWSKNTIALPAIPYAVSAKPVSRSAIRLTWSGGTPQYHLYRGPHPDSLLLLSTVTGGNSYIDSSLTEGKRYHYVVAGVNGTEGPRSEVVTTVPRDPMSILSVQQFSSNSLGSVLSHDVTSEAASSFRFIVDGSVRSLSVARSSARKVILTLPSSVSPGPHSLRILQAIDAEGMSADTITSVAFTASKMDSVTFFIYSATLENERTVRVTFNAPFALPSVKALSNFAVRSNVRSFPIASVDSIGPDAILLRIGDGDLKRVAVRIEVSVDRFVTSSTGVALNGGKGQVVSITQLPKGMDDIILFPNPVRSGMQLSFINVPERCRIRIFTPAGGSVTVLESSDAREGVRWDMRDGEGSLVSTGIYLYRIEQLDASGITEGTRLGKFAVIR